MPFHGVGRLCAAAIAALGVIASVPSHAAETLRCASLEEADAFRIRHLQSRFMVAALGCNQQAAYNAFVESFRSRLVVAGGHMTDYFVRIGGGQTALNKHITDLANAAGLSRAEEPNAFCKATWDLFWQLEQDPRSLSQIAQENLLSTPEPQSCSVTIAAQAGTKPETIPAKIDALKAAKELSAK